MAEESEKKKARSIEETPEIERPTTLSPETAIETPGETPPTPPTPVLESPLGKPEEKPPCQWFMNDNDFCDKIKKIVKCKGDVKNCPF